MNKLYFLIAFISSLNFKAQSQTEWLIRDSKNFDYLITTEINGDKIIGQTRSNALIDYMGDVKFSIAKSMTTIKFPEIVHFEGVFTKGSDHEFKGTFNHLFSELKMEGTISADTILVHLFQAGTGQRKTLIGVKINKNKKNQDYTSTVKKIIKQTEEDIYSGEFLQSKNWLQFKEVMLTNSRVMTDNLELQVGFLAIARDFPFTHFYLTKQNGENQTGDNFNLREIDSITCVLDINAFSGKRQAMDSVIKVIDTKKYKNLVIDLRDNPGGDNESAAPLLQFLFLKETIIGVFPNRKWYADNVKPPEIGEYKLFNVFCSGTLEQFYKKAGNGYGTILKCIPGKHHFTGRVFVIINKNTGSTAEIVALALQENKLATIIGQNSAGAALSAKRFKLSKNLGIFIPLNDYISYSGYRIDKKGVKPDIIVKTQEEVDHIIQNILNKEPG